MRVLVMTIVHHPEDARILHRQIRALVDAGHEVTYAAPFAAVGVAPRPAVTAVDLPRASGRRRAGAVRAARQKFHALRKDADIVLLHDPELLLAVAGPAARPTSGPPLVWDVHEDTAAALGMKSWLPAGARPVAAALVGRAEATAERSMHLLLAEHAYAQRFNRVHPVVPNEPAVPHATVPPGTGRVVYLGSISMARGAAEIVATARLLHREGVAVELMGTADAQTRPLLDAAARDGVIEWTGFVPNDVATGRLAGALAGISLLQDQPNYRHSMPTKVLEYMAHGVPVITTPTPLAVDVVTEHGCGAVVAYGDPAGVARAVLRLRDHEQIRVELGRRGHSAARASYNWRASGARFVAQLEQWGDRSSRSSHPRRAAGLAPGRPPARGVPPSDTAARDMPTACRPPAR